MDEKEKIFQFKQNARYFAKTKGSIGDMEKAVGVSPGYLSRDFKSLSMTVALRISEYLGMSIDTLFDPRARVEAEAKKITERMEKKAREKMGGKYGVN